MSEAVDEKGRLVTQHKTFPPWWWNVSNQTKPTKAQPVAIDGLSRRLIEEHDSAGALKRKYETKFSNDQWVKHGKFTQGYAPSLKHLEGEHRNGKKQGLWNVWSPRGKLSMQIRYENDVVVNQRFSPPWWSESKNGDRR